MRPAPDPAVVSASLSREASPPSAAIPRHACSSIVRVFLGAWKTRSLGVSPECSGHSARVEILWQGYSEAL